MSKTGKIMYFFIAFIFFSVFDAYFTDLILKTGYMLPENSVFDLVFIKNEGAAFNILQGSKLFLIAFSGLSILCITFSIIKNIQKISSIGLFFSAILTAGIFLNMYERMTFGYVRDFIKLNFINFPIFNLSDIFINISVFVIVIIIVRNNYFKNNENNN